jgi:hypothetical protein
MRIDQLSTMQQRVARVMPVVQMGQDRHITCRACGQEMVVSSKANADERMAAILSNIKTSSTTTTDGKQGIGLNQ